MADAAAEGTDGGGSVVAGPSPSTHEKTQRNAEFEARLANHWEAHWDMGAVRPAEPGIVTRFGALWIRQRLSIQWSKWIGDSGFILTADSFYMYWSVQNVTWLPVRRRIARTRSLLLLTLQGTHAHTDKKL